MKLIFTARNTAPDSIYEPIERHGLHAETEWLSGSGAADDPYLVRLTVKNSSEESFCGIIHSELCFEKKEPRFFLPAFMYGRNRGECPQHVENKFPRLREDSNELPSSPWWMVRGDRLSHPAAFVFDSGRVYGLCAQPYIEDEDGRLGQFCGYSCSLEGGAVGWTLGYENAPYLFVSSHNIRERETMPFRLGAGENVRAELRLYEYAAADETGINAAVKNVYYTFRKPPRSGASVPEAVRELSDAVAEYAWIEEENMYSCFVFERNGGYEYNKLGSLTWTNGLSVAVPMLEAGLRLGDGKKRDQALRFIENVIANSMDSCSGLPYDAVENGKWSVRGWWFDGMYTKGHSAYLMGQAMYYIMKAYLAEKKHAGIEHRDWLSFVSPIIQRLEKTRNTELEYPYIISEETGAGLEYDSMGGAWCMTAALMYMKITGDRKYLDQIRESERHYYEKYVKHMECYGGPLDVSKAVDNEGILAYIRAVRLLHELTREAVYLEHMYDALCYEFTFKFCYNPPVQVPPLSKVGWSACGGSVTSTANPHIHPMSSSIVDEMLYYCIQTGDRYVLDRMNDTVKWGCQTYNRYDGEFDHGKKGWMSERFCYSQGLLDEKYPDGSPASTWFALMPWGSCSIIEGLAGDYYEYIKGV